MVEPIVNAYRNLAGIPSIVWARVNGASNKITSQWSVRNLDKSKMTKYLYNYTLNNKLNVIAESDFGIDTSNEILSSVSPTESFRALIRDDKDGKDGKKQYLEVWQANILRHCIDLTALDVHGDVYADSEFGCLDWSPSEDRIVYVAEKKPVKSEPYIKRKPPMDISKSQGSGDVQIVKGAEHVYKQDWGEQLVGKCKSVIVMCTLHNENVSVLEGLPESWCPGQVRFAPDGDSVVGVAWETEPRRLGLIFCTNRPSYIFNLNLDGSYRKISTEGMAVRSPRFSTTNDRLVWLQRTTGGPHHACHQLASVNWPLSDNLETSVLIDIVQTDVKIENSQEFYGVYSQALPKRCFTKDGRGIVFSTPQQTEVRSYILDIGSGKISDISSKENPGSTIILDVNNDTVVAVRSSIKSAPQLITAHLGNAGAQVAWQAVSSLIEVPLLGETNVEYIELSAENSEDKVKSFSAIYVAPIGGNDQKLPLVVWPHGGPHSNFVNAYSLEAALLRTLGFAFLQINYRGSTGSGQALVDFLPGLAGRSDVDDCRQATEHVLNHKPIDRSKLFLFGGSHGGFLVTHLSGQFPELFRAVVSRNPVIDVVSMFNTTDIADCASVDTPNKCYHHISISFASLRVNFRGSIGQGDMSVRTLLGHVGSYDVDDCYLALTTVKERDKWLSRNAECFLYGGSFGGFTASHLSANWPDLFNATVLRNPLIDLATKGHCADNSEGCAVEAGFNFNEKGSVSEAELLAMRRCSPLAHVHKVKAPTAIMLGSGDKRVPFYQGLEYYRRLKANGCEARLYMYDDNHSLSSLSSEMDNLINSVAWFMKHMEI